MAAVTATLAAAPLVAERLLVRTYTVADGLPADNIACLESDRAGFFWVCTNHGLVRFDGARFVTFGTAHGLPDPVINHLLHDRSGTRWVATNGGGVARMESGPVSGSGRVFSAFAVGTGPRSMRVNVLLETADGALLAGTDGGLFQARSADPEPVFEPVLLGLRDYPDSGLQIWALTADAQGHIWVGTSGGLVLLAPDRGVSHFPVAPALNADHVFTILPDAAGRIWLGHDAGLLVWRPPTALDSPISAPALLDTATPCVPTTGQPLAPMVMPDAPGAVCHWAPAGAGASQVGELVTTSDGWIWMTVRASVFAFDGVALRQFHTRHALPASGVHSMGVDPGGDIWVGAINGAHRILRRGFAHFTVDDGLPPEVVRKIMRGPDGELYAVTQGASLLRLEGDRWVTVQPNLPPRVGVAGRSRYGAALLDRTGTWWIGTGAGLLRYPPVSRLEELAHTHALAHYTTADGLAGGDVWHLYEDSRGDVWIATRIPGAEPLTRWERSTGRFERYGTDDGLPAERAVYAFAEDRAGNLWASVWDGGLVRFDGLRFHYVEPGVDVPPGPRYQMAVDPAGWLWVGGRQVLVSRDPAAQHPQFEEFTTTDGLTVTAYALALGGNGWVLAGSPTGLVRLRADGRLQQLGSAGPLTSLDQPIHRDADGTIWLPRHDNILRYVPDAAGNSAAPPIWIGAVRIAGESLPVPAMGAATLPEFRLRPGQRQLEIDWFALGFGSDERLSFQFRLDDVDQAWSTPTGQLSVVYAALGPGRYRFQVRALNAAGEVSSEPATLAFVVLPPLYRRAWFVALVLTALATLLITIHRARVGRLLELERVRSRIAADLHDEIGASLARVSLMSEASRRTVRTQPAAAEALLGEIGETSRDLVTAVGDVAFCIDPGRGGLDALVARLRRFGDELLAGTDIHWKFNVAGDIAGIGLTSDQRRHLLAMAKEALHNAVRHANARRISLDLAVDHGVLVLAVRDDGHGFVAGAAHGPDGAGHGLRNMRQRAHELGAQLTIEATPGTGTGVTIRMPLGGSYRMSMQ